VADFRFFVWGNFYGLEAMVMGVAMVGRPVQGVNLPVMGPLACRACSLSIEGAKRRRLLILLAACADANEGRCCPSPALLLERVPALKGDKAKLFSVLKRLADDGFIRVLPRGGGYELLFLDAAGIE
jgi:hypothetical protein